MMLHRFWQSGWIALAIGCFAQAALAGGAPENVLLVVNSASPGSQTIANYYQELRHIPAGNVMTIDWRGSTARVDIDTFREKILLPVFKEIGEREKIGSQIDCVTY